MATVSQEPSGTSSIVQSAVVVTSSSEIAIDAPADRVFSVILDSDGYKEWNTWCPQFTFPEGQSFAVGARPTMLFKMEAQKREYHVPVEITELESPSTAMTTGARHRLAWRSMMLPAWFITIERVQEIEPLSARSCRLRNWESMAGWGAYLMKYLMGIQTQLDESNGRYAEELKGAAERL